MDLMTASPREVDEHGAQLYEQRDTYQMALRVALDNAHRLLGDQVVRPRSANRRTQWATDDSNMIERLRDHAVQPHQQVRKDVTLTGLVELPTKIEKLTADLAAVEAAFTRRGGWSRFFTVEDGHIHSGEVCKGGTIRPTTRLSWNPELSGKTEGEAVAKLGPLLCTHCFPSAPIEWTKGHEKKHCDGSGELPQVGSPYRVGMHWYGTCTGCGENQIITNNGFGVIRAHKPPKS